MENFKAMKMFLAMGEMTSKPETTVEEKVAYKERIVFATMKSMIPGWEKPSDWDSLPAETKMERLTKIEKEI